MPVNTHGTVWCNISEDNRLHTHSCESLVSRLELVYSWLLQYKKFLVMWVWSCIGIKEFGDSTITWPNFNTILQTSPSNSNPVKIPPRVHLVSLKACQLETLSSQMKPRTQCPSIYFNIRNTCCIFCWGRNGTKRKFFSSLMPKAITKSSCIVFHQHSDPSSVIGPGVAQCGSRRLCWDGIRVVGVRRNHGAPSQPASLLQVTQILGLCVHSTATSCLLWGCHRYVCSTIIARRIHLVQVFQWLCQEILQNNVQNYL